MRVSVLATQGNQKPTEIQGMKDFLSNPERMAPILFLLLGAIFFCLMPPFQAPDECNHFYRAYQIAELKLIPEKDSTTGAVGGYLPASLHATAHLFEDIPFHPEVKNSAERMARARQIVLVPDEREFITFPNTAIWNPSLYIPQATGIALGRALNLHPLSLMYLGRLINMLTGVIGDHDRTHFPGELSDMNPCRMRCRGRRTGPIFPPASAILLLRVCARQTSDKPPASGGIRCVHRGDRHAFPLLLVVKNNR